MIELKTKDGHTVQDTEVFYFYLNGPKGSEQAAIELTGADLKKLVGILNLSIGNNPGGLKLEDILGWLGTK